MICRRMLSNGRASQPGGNKPPRTPLGAVSWQWFVCEAGSDLYGRLAVVCMGGWQWFVWEAGGDLYGRVAVICIDAPHNT